MATWPRIQFCAANADTPCALATVDLKSSGPMVVELPPGPFIGFEDDHHIRMGTLDSSNRLLMLRKALGFRCLAYVLVSR
jgi:hypothetical protein